MHHARSPHCALTAVIIGAGSLGAVAPAAPSATAPATGVRLASTDVADFPLGDGTAFITGGSGLATPGQAYVDAVVSLYLAPLGFTGTTQVVTTPEELYPFFGPFGGTLDASVAQGQQTLDTDIMAKFQAGELSAAHPAVVFGWSQSAIIESQLERQLAGQGVPGDDVHFVMIGDVSAPNGGLVERFNLPDNAHPTLPSLGLTFSGAGPSDLYPTDVYTHEYDGFADFPRYPINLLSDLNALMGIVFEHTTYLGLTADQINHAIELPTSAADTLAHYYMIPADGLPLLDPLLLFGTGGKALYDLLEPDMRILVNLGYGNIADGWSPSAADVPTPLGFLPDVDTLVGILKQLPQALLNGLQQGVSAFFNDLFHPTNTTPGFLTELTGFAATLPGTQLSDFFSTPTTAQDLFGTFPAHTGIPFLDVGSALLFNLPQIDLEVFGAELAHGNLLDAVGIPIAADLGILPIALLGAVL